MKRFWLWLEGSKSRSLFQVVCAVVLTAALLWVWSFFLLLIKLRCILVIHTDPLSWQHYFNLVITYLFKAGLEEWIFRVFPAFVLFEIWNFRKPQERWYKSAFVIGCILTSAAIFGLAHGFQWQSLYIQGMGGLGHWLLFLYASRMWNDNLRDKLTGFIAASVTHCLYNLAITIFFLALAN